MATPSDADSVVTAVEDADVDDGRGDGSDSDDHEAVAFDVVLSPVVHLDVNLDGPIDAEDAAATFSCAVAGLMEALMPPIFLSSTNVLNAPDISFPRDCEPVPTPSDRHTAKRAPKKTRQKKSAIRAAMYGGPTSRSPSRASSRAASRFGGSSIALRSSVMAAKLVKIARLSVDPFQSDLWSDGVSKRLETPGVGAHWGDDNDGTASVVGTTSRRRVDVTELHRRSEIERDMSTREARRQLTQRIQRKSELPLKLRSLADPSVSFDKQEVLAASAARGGAASRLGSRPSDTRSKTPALGQQLSSLTKSVSTSSGLLKPVLDGEDLTFRSDDYRDISSSVVLLGKGGEVLVGDNCFLVARKPRAEIRHELSKKATVEPRVSLLEPLPVDHEKPTGGPESPSASPLQGSTRLSVGNALPLALSVDKSNSQPPVSPAFAGSLGSFERYPRLEMDPAKTQLAKGVTIIDDESSTAVASTSSSKRRHSKAVTKPLSPSRPHHLAAIKSSPASPEAGLSPSKDAPEPPQDVAPIVEKRARGVGVEGSSDTPKRGSDKAPVLHSLRARTPALERRSPTSKQSRNRFILAQLDESAVSESVASAERTREVPVKPRAKYMREFPSPPPGTIHVFSSAHDSEAANSFPFRALPSIVKAKRQHEVDDT